MTNKINIVGIGHKPLDSKASEIILNADLIVSSGRLAEVFKGCSGYEQAGGKIKVINNVDEAVNFIKSAISSQQSEIRSVAFLASGDPLFFGIGRRMINEFGRDNVEIFPDLSSIQIAFARIKEPWDDAMLTSIHGTRGHEKKDELKHRIDDIPILLERHNKLCILTDKINNPAVIANKLSAISSQRSDFMMYVCERLGYLDERIIEGAPDEVAKMTFAEPNVVIIKNQLSADSRQPAAFGLREIEITHSRGLITKDEVRAVVLHKLRLPQTGVLWDIGAGSGSVSIEAARLCPGLKVFAIEKDKKQSGNLHKNRLRFNAENIDIINGEAPQSLDSLPQPDRVFIGGSNGRLEGIMELISGKTQAKIAVINATTIETLNEAVQCLEKNGFETEISEISVSRSKTIAGKRHLSALNPVFIVKGGRN